MRNGRFARVGRGRSVGGWKPPREWIAVAGTPFNAVLVTTASSLYSFQAPTVTIGTPLNFDAPEDLTLLRIRAEMQVNMSTTGVWALVLLVQDTDWTPSGYVTDSDKRFLWSRVYQNLGDGVASWAPGMEANTNASVITFRTAAVDSAGMSYSCLDISPKVRLEAGKALFLVAYELVNGATFTVTLHNMRILQTRARKAGRR